MSDNWSDPNVPAARSPDELEAENASLRQQLANRQPLSDAEPEPAEKITPTADQVLAWIATIMIRTNRTAWPENWNMPGENASDE